MSRCIWPESRWWITDFQVSDAQFSTNYLVINSDFYQFTQSIISTKTFSISPLKCAFPQKHTKLSRRACSTFPVWIIWMQIYKFKSSALWSINHFESILISIFIQFFYLLHQSTFSLVPFIFILFQCVFLLFDFILFDIFGLNWLNVRMQLRKLCISLDIDHDLPQNIICIYQLRELELLFDTVCSPAYSVIFTKIRVLY